MLRGPSLKKADREELKRREATGDRDRQVIMKQCHKNANITMLKKRKNIAFVLDRNRPAATDQSHGEEVVTTLKRRNFAVVLYRNRPATTEQREEVVTKLKRRNAVDDQDRHRPASTEQSCWKEVVTTVKMRNATEDRHRPAPSGGLSQKKDILPPNQELKRRRNATDGLGRSRHISDDVNALKRRKSTNDHRRAQAQSLDGQSRKAPSSENPNRDPVPVDMVCQMTTTKRSMFKLSKKRRRPGEVKLSKSPDPRPDLDPNPRPDLCPDCEVVGRITSARAMRRSMRINSAIMEAGK